MAKVSINAEDASNAFFNVTDVIEALKRFDGVLQTPLSDDDDEEGYLIGDCLDDIKMLDRKSTRLNSSHT